MYYNINYTLIILGIIIIIILNICLKKNVMPKVVDFVFVAS